MSERNENYGSAFLYSEDLLFKQKYTTVQVEISEVHPPNTLQTKDKKFIDKWSIRFKGKDKTLVLCKTNTSILHHVIGDQPGDSWIKRLGTKAVWKGTEE